MVANLKTLFRLFCLYAKMDLLWFLRDTKYCLLFIAADLIGVLATFSGVLLLAVQFDGIGAMTRTEVLFMLAYATTVDGVFALFFMNNNMMGISRIIGRGQLDHNMVQPVPLWMQLATAGFAPVSGNSTLLLGLGMLIFATAKLEAGVGFVWILRLACSIVCSMLLQFCFLYSISCSAFYAPVAAEEISGEVLGFTSIKVYPLGGFGAFGQTVLTTVIPVGLAAWLPSLALLGKDTQSFLPASFFSLVAICVISLLLTSLLFRRGLRHYAKIGSPRYSGFGFRS